MAKPKEISYLNTKIDKEIKGRRRILISANADQLWYIMLGLERLNLADRLERGTHKLAKEIKGIGIDNFGWIKT